jgi:hypothetical protein
MLGPHPRGLRSSFEFAPHSREMGRGYGVRPIRGFMFRRSRETSVQELFVPVASSSRIRASGMAYREYAPRCRLGQKRRPPARPHQGPLGAWPVQGRRRTPPDRFRPGPQRRPPTEGSGASPLPSECGPQHWQTPHPDSANRSPAARRSGPPGACRTGRTAIHRRAAG